MLSDPLSLLPAFVTSGFNSGQVAKVPFFWKLSYNLNLKKNAVEAYEMTVLAGQILGGNQQFHIHMGKQTQH